MIEFLFRQKFSGMQVILYGLVASLFSRGEVILGLIVSFVGTVGVVVLTGFIAEYDKQHPNRKTP